MELSIGSSELSTISSLAAPFSRMPAVPLGVLRFIPWQRYSEDTFSFELSPLNFKKKAGPKLMQSSPRIARALVQMRRQSYSSLYVSRPRLALHPTLLPDGVSLFSLRDVFCLCMLACIQLFLYQVDLVGPVPFGFYFCIGAFCCNSSDRPHDAALFIIAR